MYLIDIVKFDMTLLHIKNCHSFCQNYLKHTLGRSTATSFMCKYIKDYITVFLIDKFAMIA